MRQWREIATCADRSFFRNNWMHALIKHLTKQLNNFRANAAESKREDVCATPKCAGAPKPRFAPVPARRRRQRFAQVRAAYRLIPWNQFYWELVQMEGGGASIACASVLLWRIDFPGA